MFPETKKETRGSPALFVSGNFHGKTRGCLELHSGNSRVSLSLRAGLGQNLRRNRGNLENFVPFCCSQLGTASAAKSNWPHHLPTYLPTYHHGKPSAPARARSEARRARAARRGGAEAGALHPARGRHRLAPQLTALRPRAGVPQASLLKRRLRHACPLTRHPPRPRPAASPLTERSAARRRRRASRAATLALALTRSAQAERSSLAQTEQRPRQRSLLRPPDARAAAAAAVAASSLSLPPPAPPRMPLALTRALCSGRARVCHRRSSRSVGVPGVDFWK